MSSSFGDKIKIQLCGQSHARGVGVVIDGLPAGEKIDLDAVNVFLQRRAGGKSYTTPRRETDTPEIISGLIDGVTCGAPLGAIFYNQDTRSNDYAPNLPRPGHADYPAFVKHHGNNDYRGGGHFSGRLTLPLCFAGALCLQILARRGIFIGAHIHQIGEIFDPAYDAVNVKVNDFVINEFPTRDVAVGEKMRAQIAAAQADGDSLGGVIEAAIIGVPVGLGAPIFANWESKLAAGLFAIPAVKGVEFGAGFRVANLTGKANNDEFYYDEFGAVKTRTNHAGGILGGLSNGMPIIFRVAFKPTPSISAPQTTLDLTAHTTTALQIRGRHDPCIVPRAVPVVEAVAAIVAAEFVI